MKHKSSPVVWAKRPALARLALMLALAGAGSLRATTLTTPIPILDISGGMPEDVVTGSDMTGGFQFDVETQVAISGLGFFDVGGNGLFRSHQVGLWNVAGSLLATVFVDNSALQVASTSAFGNWLEVAIPQVTLAPGTYVLGATYTNAATVTEDKGVFYTSAAPNSTVIYDNWAIQLGSAFAFPGVDIGGNAQNASFFGPMAFVGGITPTPEPGTTAMLLGGVVLMIVMKRWQIGYLK